MPLRIAAMACSRTPKWRFRPYGVADHIAVEIESGPNESAPLTGVLLDSARSEGPPHSSGRVSERAWMASAEAFRVAIPLGSASHVGSPVSQPSGKWPDYRRSKSCLAAGFASSEQTEIAFTRQ